MTRLAPETRISQAEDAWLEDATARLRHARPGRIQTPAPGTASRPTTTARPDSEDLDD